MTESEFFEFWNNYQWAPVKSVHYRLYYNDAGDPEFYSHEVLSGKYIDVTAEQFALQDMKVKVVDEKVVQQKTIGVTKLVPADSGTLCDVTDVTVVVSDQSGKYWKNKHHVVEEN